MLSKAPHIGTISPSPVDTRKLFYDALDTETATDPGPSEAGWHFKKYAVYLRLAHRLFPAPEGMYTTRGRDFEVFPTILCYCALTKRTPPLATTTLSPLP